MISSHNDDDPLGQDPVRGHDDPRPRGGEEAGVHGGLGPVAEVCGAHALGDGGAVAVHFVVAANLALDVISISDCYLLFTIYANAKLNLGPPFDHFHVLSFLLFGVG